MGVLVFCWSSQLHYFILLYFPILISSLHYSTFCIMWCYMSHYLFWLLLSSVCNASLSLFSVIFSSAYMDPYRDDRPVWPDMLSLFSLFFSSLPLLSSSLICCFFLLPPLSSSLVLSSWIWGMGEMWQTDVACPPTSPSSLPPTFSPSLPLHPWSDGTLSFFSFSPIYRHTPHVFYSILCSFCPWIRHTHTHTHVFNT